MIKNLKCRYKKQKKQTTTTKFKEDIYQNIKAIEPT